MLKTIALAAFASTIIAANWMIGNVGTTCIPNGPCLIPVGFGLMAPSGVLMIGLALVLRDWVQELMGWKWSVAAVLFGGLLSLAVSPASIAFASAVAFTFSELLDAAVYTPLRKRSIPIAIVGSQIVGAFADSALFVFVAFGSLDFTAGNALAKIYAGVLVATTIIICGKRRPAQLS